MTKKLIIVESPAKAVTLKKYLGRSAKVMATVGHIKNLPKSKLGVDTDNQYQTSFVTIKGKGKVLKEIKSASKQVDEIYLAPDPDREGEAIADHIATELKSDKPLYRVTFNEITKKAVTKALENPGQINKNRVQAQLTRRILDRLVGYKLSPLLWNKVRLGLSAGRVQSVALHVVVKREKEILAFVPTEYWNIEALVKNSDDAYFMTKLMKIDGKAAKIANQAEAEAIFNQISNSPLTISKIEKKERSRHSAPPFITSTLQQEASRRFRFNARTTMSAAQKLYEGMEVGSHGHVGLITYMRTDSTRVSEDALDAVRAQIESDFGSKFLPSQPNFYKNKKSAQDAHEAIRPTDITLTPTKVKPFLGKREFVIYDIIWKRFLASQMASAIFDRTTVDLKSDNKILRATGSIMKFSGFLKVYEESKEEEELPSDSGLDSNMIPPSIKEGDAMEIVELTKTQKFTQPPARYSEATLIKTMEELGIGRPSTYASTVSLILDRDYVTVNERKLSPTELGITVTDLLVENFPEILTAEFTAHLEGELDQVEDGSKDWITALDQFYIPFSKEYELAKVNMRSIKGEVEKTDIVCDKCGKSMVIKFGRFGKFLACGGYPECKNSKELNKDGEATTVADKKEDEPTEFICPKCSKVMVKKHGRFGEYIACSDYPTCKSTRAIGTSVECPVADCKGELVKKMTRRGKPFYACSKYPDCDYAIWNEPLAKECPDCSFPILEKKVLKAGLVHNCPEKGCSYKENVDDEDNEDGDE